MESTFLKLQELFYTAQADNIELAYQLAQANDNQQFIQFYQHWQEYIRWANVDYEVSSAQIAERLQECQEHKVVGFEHQGWDDAPDWLLTVCQAYEILSLSSNKLQAIPEKLRVCQHLQGLSFNWNQISSLPDWLAEWPRLRSLHLNFNPINQLPPQVGALQRLQHLALISSGKRLEVAEEVANLPFLTHLSVGQKQGGCKELPKPIFGCRGLRFLNLYGYEIEQLPTELAQLQMLEELCFQYSQIQDFGAVLTKLPKLKCLRINDPSLQIFPSELLHLEQLTILDLSESGISALPADIDKLRNLLYLELSGCSFNSQSIEYWEAFLRRKLPKLEVNWGFF